MPGPALRKLFVNLPVRDLAASKRFFSRLGFEFDVRFTDELAACLIISDGAYVMLLSEPFFDTFAPKPRCDTGTEVEGWVLLSCRSRAELATLLAEALAAGGTPAGVALDHGFMCSAGFHDLDGHHWQLRWTHPHPVLA